jgi:hypothetical protein
MTIEDFKGLMDAFDPASLLPELDAVMGKIALIVRIAVVIGPAALLVMGLVYLFASPKEANYTLGYRCYFGMGSVEAWQFTQKLAGIVFAALGFGLGIVMLLISGSFAAMETMDLLWRAVWCMVWEAGLTAAACIAVNTAVMLRFDRNGLLRR